MINIILNKKIINFYKIIKEAIVSNGFAKYIIETVTPTFKFFLYFKKYKQNLFFIIKKLILKISCLIVLLFF